MDTRQASQIARRFFTVPESAHQKRAFLIWYPLVLAVTGVFGRLFATPLVVLVEMLLGSTITLRSMMALCSGTAQLRIYPGCLEPACSLDMLWAGCRMHSTR